MIIIKILIISITIRNFISVKLQRIQRIFAFELLNLFTDTALFLISERVLLSNLGIYFESLDLATSLRDHKHCP